MEKKTLNSGCVLAATGFGSNLFLDEHAYIHRTGCMPGSRRKPFPSTLPVTFYLPSVPPQFTMPSPLNVQLSDPRIKEIPHST